jgi:hypothetical protein
MRPNIVLSLMLIGLGTVALPASAAGDPNPVAAFSLYHDFRQGNPLPAGLTLEGMDAEKYTAQEPGGLRINLPATRKAPGPLRGVGFALNHEIAGDFEITAGYEILSTGPVTGDEGVGVDLFYKCGPTGNPNGRWGRFNTKDGPVFEDGASNMSAPGYIRVPTTATKGRLRLALRGGTLLSMVSEETAGDDFKTMIQSVMGAETFTYLLLEVNPGNQATPIDVRLVDLRIQSSGVAFDSVAEFPTNPTDTGPRGWRMGTGLFAGWLALALALALAGCLYIRRRTKTTGTQP